MKNPALSLWLTAANQATGWWMGHAANAVRAQQRMAFDAMTKEIAKATTGAKPKRSRKAARRRRRAAHR